MELEFVKNVASVGFVSETFDIRLKQCLFFTPLSAFCHAVDKQCTHRTVYKSNALEHRVCKAARQQDILICIKQDSLVYPNTCLFESYFANFIYISVDHLVEFILKIFRIEW